MTEKLAELKEQQAAIEKKIREVAEQVKNEGIAKLKVVAAQHGITDAEAASVFGAVVPKTKSRAGKPGVRYFNPANPAQTYSGKGRAPDWWKEIPKDQRAACKVL